MSNNPFEILFVFTVTLLIASTMFGIAAPQLGIETPDPPVFPMLNDLSVRGNFSAEYAFDQTLAVGARNGLTEVRFDGFAPDKIVKFVVSPIDNSVQYFLIQREGSIVILNVGYDEPIAYLNGTLINSDLEQPWYYAPYKSTTLRPQTIVDNYDGTSSIFIVDPGNDKYECYASFTPLAGYSDMVSSWNEGRGFTLRLYGNAYEEPGWPDQVAAYLAWFASIIAYFVYFLAYMIQTAAVLFTVIGLVPELAAGIVVLIMVVFVGSLLMFLRGSGGGGK